jgi:hypothetical protein
MAIEDDPALDFDKENFNINDSSYERFEIKKLLGKQVPSFDNGLRER